MEKIQEIMLKILQFQTMIKILIAPFFLIFGQSGFAQKI